MKRELTWSVPSSWWKGPAYSKGLNISWPIDLPSIFDHKFTGLHVEFTLNLETAGSLEFFLHILNTS